MRYCSQNASRLSYLTMRDPKQVPRNFPKPEPPKPIVVEFGPAGINIGSIDSDCIDASEFESPYAYSEQILKFFGRQAALPALYLNNHLNDRNPERLKDPAGLLASLNDKEYHSVQRLMFASSLNQALKNGTCSQELRDELVRSFRFRVPGEAIYFCAALQGLSDPDIVALHLEHASRAVCSDDFQAKFLGLLSLYALTCGLESDYDRLSAPAKEALKACDEATGRKPPFHSIISQTLASDGLCSTRPDEFMARQQYAKEPHILLGEDMVIQPPVPAAERPSLAFQAANTLIGTFGDCAVQAALALMDIWPRYIPETGVNVLHDYVRDICFDVSSRMLNAFSLGSQAKYTLFEPMLRLGPTAEALVAVAALWRSQIVSPEDLIRNIANASISLEGRCWFSYLLGHHHFARFAAVISNVAAVLPADQGADLFSAFHCGQYGGGPGEALRLWQARKLLPWIPYRDAFARFLS